MSRSSKLHRTEKWISTDAVHIYIGTVYARESVDKRDSEDVVPREASHPEGDEVNYAFQLGTVHAGHPPPCLKLEYGANV